jgi:signal peptidase I
MKKYIENTLFIFICGFLLFGVLSQFGILPFKITYFLTGSMSPAFNPGDLAVIHTGKGIQVKPGDVVYFYVHANPIIHRVKSIENGQIITQGDANNTPDKVKLNSVEGKLIFSIPKIGYLIDYFHVFIQWVTGLIPKVTT